MARTFRHLIAVCQPMPPLCECVTRIPGPILLNSAATASEVTSASIGPVSGVIWRKYWFRASGSRENCTPGKSLAKYHAESVEPFCSSGTGVKVIGWVLRPALHDEAGQSHKPQNHVEGKCFDSPRVHPVLFPKFLRTARSHARAREVIYERSPGSGKTHMRDHRETSALQESVLYGSKVPGVLITVPPTAKLPCSWMISGAGSPFPPAIAVADTIMATEIRRRAVDNFRCFGLIEFAHQSLWSCPR